MAAFAEGTPCWLDVSLPDLAAGKRFYGELFGWTFGPEAGPEVGRYTEALSGGKRVAGLAAKSDGRMPTAWGVYFASGDVAALVRRIEAEGGTVVQAPTPIGRFGVMAHAADPGGAVFGLWQAGDDSGFEKQGRPGSFCWTEVYTRAPEAVDRFYEAVLGVTGTDLAGVPGESVPFRAWSPAGTVPGPDTAVGGRSVITDAFPKEMPGHFLSYFAVTDCDAVASDVVRLGGRVTEAPFDIPYGRMAVLTDNQGATFAVLAEPAEPAGGTGSAAAAAAAPADPRAGTEHGPEREQAERPTPRSARKAEPAPAPGEATGPAPATD